MHVIKHSSTMSQDMFASQVSQVGVLWEIPVYPAEDVPAEEDLDENGPTLMNNNLAEVAEDGPALNNNLLDKTQESVANNVMCQHSKKYLKESYIRNHVKICMGEGAKLKCKFCEKSFLHKVRKDEHEKKVHLKEVIKIVCTECGKVFRREATMRTHMQIHKDESYQCNLCEKVFDSMYKNKEHRRKVHQPRATCPVCFKEFAQKQNVQKHMLVAHK